MRKVLKENKLAFKRWQKTMLEYDRVEYRLKRRKAKKTVAIAKTQGTQELYDELETKEREKRIYRIARTRYRERENTGNINIIKDKEGKIQLEEDKIGARWAEYFEELAQSRRTSKRDTGRRSDRGIKRNEEQQSTMQESAKYMLLC